MAVSVTRWGLIGLFTLPLLACGPQTPEDRMRAMIDRAQASAERRDAAAIYALLCEDFSDHAGMTGDDTLHFMIRYLLLHRPVYALARLVRFETWDLGEGRAELYAALAGQTLDSVADLSHVQAEVLHLTLDLVNDEDGDLCVRRAVWEPATARDMLLTPRLGAQE